MGYELEFIECSREEACSKYKDNHKEEYDIYNWTRALNLECESEMKLSLLGALFFVGFMIGSLFFPRLADIYGRKLVTFFSFFVQIMTDFMMLYATNLATLYAALFLLGLRFSPGFQVPYVMMLEFVGAKYRNCYSALMLASFGLQSILLAAYYTIVRDFRPLMIFNAILTVLVAFLFCLCVPQSPRFYVVKRQFDKARTVLNKIAVRNNKQQITCQLEGESAHSSSSKQPGTGIRDLFTAGCYIVLPLLVMSLNWFIVTLVFYGFSIGLKYLNVNLYMIALVAASAELLGSSSSLLFAAKCGRKRGLIFCQFIAALACFLYFLAVHAEDWKVALCLLFGVLGNTAAFNIIYLLTSQLFPTSFRATVFGMTNFIARLGGVFAPMVIEYMRTSYMGVLGGASLLSCLISLLLRETKNQDLQDNLDADPTETLE